jgi:hypothetical protein
MVRWWDVTMSTVRLNGSTLVVSVSRRNRRESGIVNGVRRCGRRNVIDYYYCVLWYSLLLFVYTFTACFTINHQHLFHRVVVCACCLQQLYFSLYTTCVCVC